MDGNDSQNVTYSFPDDRTYVMVPIEETVTYAISRIQDTLAEQ